MRKDFHSEWSSIGLILKTFRIYFLFLLVVSLMPFSSWALSARGSEAKGYRSQHFSRRDIATMLALTCPKDSWKEFEAYAKKTDFLHKGLYPSIKYKIEEKNRVVLLSEGKSTLEVLKDKSLQFTYKGSTVQAPDMCKLFARASEKWDAPLHPSKSKGSKAMTWVHSLIPFSYAENDDLVPHSEWSTDLGVGLGASGVIVGMVAMTMSWPLVLAGFAVAGLGIKVGFDAYSLNSVNTSLEEFLNSSFKLECSEETSILRNDFIRLEILKGQEDFKVSMINLETLGRVIEPFHIRKKPQGLIVNEREPNGSVFLRMIGNKCNTKEDAEALNSTFADELRVSKERIQLLESFDPNNPFRDGTKNNPQKEPPPPSMAPFQEDRRGGPEEDRGVQSLHEYEKRK